MFLFLSLMIISTAADQCGIRLAESVGLTSTTRQGGRAAHTPGDAIRRYFEISEVTQHSLSAAQEIPMQFTDMISWVPTEDLGEGEYTFDLLLDNDTGTALLLVHKRLWFKRFFHKKVRDQTYLLRLTSKQISGSFKNKLFSGGRRYTTDDASSFAKSLTMDVSENTSYAHLTFTNDTGTFALALRARAKVEDQFKIPFVFAMAETNPTKVAHSGIVYFVTSQRALRQFFQSQRITFPRRESPSLDLKLLELPRHVEDRRVKVHRARMRWNPEMRAFVIQLNDGRILSVDLIHQDLRGVAR